MPSLGSYTVPDCLERGRCCLHSFLRRTLSASRRTLRLRLNADRGVLGVSAHFALRLLTLLVATARHGVLRACLVCGHLCLIAVVHRYVMADMITFVRAKRGCMHLPHPRTSCRIPRAICKFIKTREPRAEVLKAKWDTRVNRHYSLPSKHAGLPAALSSTTNLLSVPCVAQGDFARQQQGTGGHACQAEDKAEAAPGQLRSTRDVDTTRSRAYIGQMLGWRSKLCYSGRFSGFTCRALAMHNPHGAASA